MKKSHLLFLLLAVSVSLLQAQSAGDKTALPALGQRPVIYVMPNALIGPGSRGNPQIIEGSAHEGKEPQVAMIYKELQHRKECQPFVENIIKDKANYFLLLQHGGGKGNRWVVSDPNGNVISSGDSLLLGNSVKDACVAMSKDWQQRSGSAK